MYYQKTYFKNAKKQEYNGFQYDSGFEANYAMELDLRVKAKDIKGYDKQINLDLMVNGYVVCQYRIDFIVYHNDGMIEYVETKGYPTREWKLKWKLFEALYTPEIPGNENNLLTVVQQGKFKTPKLRKKK